MELEVIIDTINKLATENPGMVALLGTAFSGFAFVLWQRLIRKKVLPEPVKETPAPQKSISIGKVTGGQVGNEMSISGDNFGEVQTVHKGQGDIHLTTINNIEGLPQKVVDVLLETLEEKKVQLAGRDAKLEEMAKQYQELESRLADRKDAISEKAREALNNGDLEEAEELLKESLAENLRIAKERNEQAADDAYELANLAELQLRYQEALDYYQQAATLAPGNSLYLNEMGCI